MVADMKVTLACNLKGVLGLHKSLEHISPELCSLHLALQHGCSLDVEQQASMIKREDLPNHLCTPLIRDASNMLKLIIVLLYMITPWFDWMKPMPPMSAAKLKT
jgi:hypothetical protein